MRKGIFFILLLIFFDASSSDWLKKEITMEDFVAAGKTYIEELTKRKTEWELKLEKAQKSGDTYNIKTINGSIEHYRRAILERQNQWADLKKQYRQGDKIIYYEAPPLSGPIGYYLARDGMIIYQIIMAYR